MTGALLPILLLLASPIAQGNVPSCEFQEQKVVLAKSARGHTAEWTLPHRQELYFALKNAGPLHRRHENWVRRKTSLDAKGIMERAAGIFARAAESLDPSDGGRPIFFDSVSDMQQILQGRAGKIRPISCLEAIAFQEFLGVVDLTKTSAEFLVYILEKEGVIKIIGDFYRPANRSVIGVTTSGALTRRLEALRRLGWKVFGNLHNHPFSFGSGEDIGGNIAPSAPDLELYRSLGSSYSLITNGIETLELKREELPLFKGGL